MTMSCIGHLALLLMFTVAGTSSCSRIRGFSASKQDSPSVQTPTGWQRIDLGRFLLSIPLDMKRVDVKGIDSSVWEFKSSTTRLTIDLGPYYSEDLSTYKEWPDF